MERQELNKGMDIAVFRSFYYLKEELIDFCRSNGLPTSGKKMENADRIAIFLESGVIIKQESKGKKTTVIMEITPETKIEANHVCSQRHRAFFKNAIGKSFSFNTTFQNWLKEHTGEAYRAAILAYYEIMEDKKHNKTTIDKQFEYNRYIREFFAQNKDRTLQDAIRCWKFKKSLPGNNQYHDDDLQTLNNKED